MSGIVQLEKTDPVSPVGIHLQTFQDALDLLAWAHTNADYTCTVSDKIGNTWTVQIEGVSVGTAIGTEGQWIIQDGNQFLVMSDEERINNGYRIV